MKEERVFKKRKPLGIRLLPGEAGDPRAAGWGVLLTQRSSRRAAGGPSVASGWRVP